MKVALKVMFAVVVALVLLQPGSVSAQKGKPPQGGTPLPELAYISAGNNHDLVLVANADGSGVTEVFGRSQLHDWSASWSPDGKYVAVDSVWGLMTGGFILLIDAKQKSFCDMPGYVPHEATSEEPEWNPRFANGRYTITFKEGALSSDGRYQIELFLVEVNLPSCTLWSHMPECIEKKAKWRRRNFLVIVSSNKVSISFD